MCIRDSILVNGKKVDIPSFIVKPGTTIEVKEKSKNLAAINEALEACLNTVAFVDVDKDAKKGTYLRLSLIHISSLHTKRRV